MRHWIGACVTDKSCTKTYPFCTKNKATLIHTNPARNQIELEKRNFEAHWSRLDSFDRGIISRQNHSCIKLSLDYSLIFYQARLHDVTHIGRFLLTQMQNYGSSFLWKTEPILAISILGQLNHAWASVLASRQDMYANVQWKHAIKCACVLVELMHKSHKSPFPHPLCFSRICCVTVCHRNDDDDKMNINIFKNP